MYLTHFGIFTHKGFIRTGEFGGELVDVQHVDGDGHPAGQDWTVWRRKNSREKVRNTPAAALPTTDTMWISEVLLFEDASRQSD